MDIHASKLKLVELILDIENKQVIEHLINILKSKDEDFWLELTNDQKKEIELGIKQLDSGKRISLEDFLKKVS